MYTVDTPLAGVVITPVSTFSPVISVAALSSKARLKATEVASSAHSETLIK